MTRFMLAAVFALLVVPALAADTATLTVKIGGVSTKGGTLRLGVYDKASFSVRGATPVTGAIVPAKAGETVITVGGIAPGVYGLKVVQDENGNGHMDTNMIGMPTEPFGISRDARPNMGPPSWGDAKIELEAGANTAVIHMQ